MSPANRQYRMIKVQSCFENMHFKFIPFFIEYSIPVRKLQPLVIIKLRMNVNTSGKNNAIAIFDNVPHFIEIVFFPVQLNNLNRIVISLYPFGIVLVPGFGVSESYFDFIAHGL